MLMSEHCCSWFDANIDLVSKELFIDEMLGYLADSDLYTCMEDYYYYWNATAKHIIAKHVNLILYQESIMRHKRQYQEILTSR